MTGYDTHPAVDATTKAFPPEIRAAAANSPEINARFDGLGTTFTSLQGQIDTVNNTRQHYNYRWANAAARTAQLGMRKYDLGTQIDTGQRYEYSGTEWLVRSTTLTVLTAAERTALLGKAVPGAVTLDSEGTSYRYARTKVAGTSLPVFGTAATSPVFAWQPWDSDWFQAIPTFTGLTGTAYGTPGWIPGGMYRYISGRVFFIFGFSLNSAMTPGAITVALPVNAHQYGIFNSGSSQSGQDGLNTNGRAWRKTSSRWYDLALTFASNSTLGVMVMNSAQYMDGVGGGSWAQSEVFLGNITYDPA